MWGSLFLPLERCVALEMFDQSLDLFVVIRIFIRFPCGPVLQVVAGGFGQLFYDCTMDVLIITWVVNFIFFVKLFTHLVVDCLSLFGQKNGVAEKDQPKGRSHFAAIGASVGIVQIDTSNVLYVTSMLWWEVIVMRFGDCNDPSVNW